MHVDGAFGLWAAVTPALATLAAGLESADSWATDAHKTLNTPYDCGVAIVADASRMHASLGLHASYLLTASTVDPFRNGAGDVPPGAWRAGVGCTHLTR